MKALVAAFNQEKALVGAFSVIVQPVVEPMEQYTALEWTNISITSCKLHLALHLAFLYSLILYIQTDLYDNLVYEHDNTLCQCNKNTVSFSTKRGGNYNLGWDSVTPIVMRHPVSTSTNMTQ